MASRETSSPAGRPSTIAISAGPCDSPAVRYLSRAMRPSSHRRGCRRLLEYLLALAERELVVSEQHRGAPARGRHELEAVGERLALLRGVHGAVHLYLGGRPPAVVPVDVHDPHPVASHTAGPARGSTAG